MHRLLQLSLALLIVSGIWVQPLAPRPAAHGRYASPNLPDDYRLTVYAVGAWAGDFGTDDYGRGGLAALHALLETRRKLAAANQEGVLLVQAGDFTGAGTVEELRARTVFPELNLIRYMQFDALAPGARELALFAAEASGVEAAPLVSLNARPRPNAQRPAPARTGPAPAAPAPFRIVERNDHTVWISALTSGAEPDFDAAPTERLVREMRRNDGAELYVLLLDDSAPPTEETRPWRRPAELLRDEGFWNATFPQSASELNPYRPDARDRLTQQWLMIQNGAANVFRRLPEGPHLCRIAGRTVCEIEFEFRARKLRGVRQRFIDLNGPQAPQDWIAPDPLIYQTLQKIPPRRDNSHPTLEL